MPESAPPPSAPAAFSIRLRLMSFVHAGRGLRWLVQGEHNAWVHLAATVAVILAGFALDLSLADWRWIVLAIALVWLAEALNTAIEELADRVCSEFDPAIGRVKDIAAGGVLVASIAAAAIGGLTFIPAIIEKL